MTAAQTLQRIASGKSFRVGLGVAAAVYTLSFGFAWLNAAETISSLQAHLADNIIPIERIKAAIPYGPPAPSGTTTRVDGKTEATGLPKAPLDGLVEETQDGKLPLVRASDNLSPFTAYRRAFTLPKAGAPTIALGIRNFGLSDTNSKLALGTLPADVTMVMTPYTKAPDFWIAEARSSGHEVWLALPVETDTYPRNDSGPETLTLGGLPQMNLRKLHWTMGIAQGYAGLVAPNLEAFFRSDDDAKPILAEIFKRGIGFIDGNPSSPDSLVTAATKQNTPLDNVDLWLDQAATPDHLPDELKQLEDIAQKNGSAIGMIAATPDNLKMLKAWIDTLPAKGIALAPLSARAMQNK